MFLLNYLVPISIINKFLYLEPQQRFLPNFNTNDGATQLAGLGSLGVGAFALGNVLSGNDNVRLSPQFGANFDPNSGAM